MTARFTHDTNAYRLPSHDSDVDGLVGQLDHVTISLTGKSYVQVLEELIRDITTILREGAIAAQVAEFDLYHLLTLTK